MNRFLSTRVMFTMLDTRIEIRWSEDGWELSRKSPHSKFPHVQFCLPLFPYQTKNLKLLALSNARIPFGDAPRSYLYDPPRFAPAHTLQFNRLAVPIIAHQVLDVVGVGKRGGCGP